jgi:hypothetical protein
MCDGNEVKEPGRPRDKIEGQVLQSNIKTCRSMGLGLRADFTGGTGTRRGVTRKESWN